MNIYHSKFTSFGRWITTVCLSLFAINSIAQNTPNLSQTAPAGSVTEISVPDPIPSLQGSGYNFFRTYQPLTRTSVATDLNAFSDPNLVKIVTTFKDGFNKPIEEINSHYTLNGKQNFVFPYDTRIVPGGSYSFLPYARDFSSGLSTDIASSYSPYTLTYQKDYYNTMFPGEGYTSYSAIQNFSDANSRTTKLILPGRSQIGQSNGVTAAKITNDANTIRIWTMNQSDEAVATGFYNSDALLGTSRVNSESQVNISFSDKNGQLVYKKTKVKNSPLTYAETYYVYDDLTRLRYVLTPKAIAAIGTGTTVPSDVLTNLCYSYTYDEVSRLRNIHLPGQQENIYLVYDRFQRLVMRQSPKEKSEGKWEVNYYDKLGRVIATSVFLSNNDASYWQGRMDAPPLNPLSSTLEYYLTTDQGEGQLPGESSIPNNTMMAYYFYDHYGNTIDSNSLVYNQLVSEQAFTSDILNTPESEYPTRSNRVFNQLTGEKLRIVRTNGSSSNLGDWRWNTFYYDDKGRVIATAVLDKLQNDAQLSYRLGQYVSNQYDFSNRTILTKHTIINTSAKDVSKRHVELVKNEFEPGTGLLKTIKHKVDGNPWNLISQNSYDELSRPKRHILGDYGEVQDLDYNIRGQLTGINAVYAETGNKQGQSKSFGQSLKYDYGFDQVRRDGKISGMVWRGSGGLTTNPLAYGYSYDDAGRLKQADFRELASGSWTNANIDYSVSNLNYDLAGNTISMKQRGMGFENGVLVSKDIDRLRYTYETNSHRLNNVFDTTTINYNLGDFVDNNPSGTDYEYDTNGNVIKDRNKKIASIVYNDLNKPSVITMENGSNLNISYDAKGSKVEEITSQFGQTKKVNYVGNFVYKNDSLQYLLTDEGRTVYNQLDSSIKEEFFVQDYLGNIRSVVDVHTYNTIDYLASFELASANLESFVFSQLNEVRDNKPGSINPQDVKAGRLNASETDKRIGAALLLKVMAGDRIEMNVNNFFDGFNSDDSPPIGAEEMLGSIVSTLTNGAGGFVGSESHDVKMVNQLFTPGNYLQGFTKIVNQSSDPSLPQSSLNYILFDDKMRIVGEYSGAFQANGNGTWTTLGTTSPIEIPINGFIAVYLDNKSPINVYYDLLEVKFTKGKLREENHYYPHGLPMEYMASTAEGFMEHKHRYQGNENNIDMGLNVMDFNYRQYDAQLGRFMSVDPVAALTDAISPYVAMNNNPIKFIDPLGLTGESASNAWMMDEVVIYGNGKTKVIKNPGGGSSIDAPFSFGSTGPSGGGAWDRNLNGDSKGVYMGSGGSGQGGSIDGNKDHVGPNTPGSPTGTKDGVQGGTGTGDGTGTAKSGSSVNNTGTDGGDLGPLKALGIKGSGNGSSVATAAAVAIGSWILVDETTPDPTDAIPLKHIAYGAAAAGFILGAKVAESELLKKMAKELDRILSKAKTGRQGYVYELRVIAPGLYRDVRGMKVWLNAGDIWKFGESTTERYSPNTLDNMVPGGVIKNIIYTGNQMEIKVYEKYCIYGYFMNNFRLPPGNRIFR